MCVNFPGLEKWLIDSEKDGVAYRVTVGKEKVTDDLSPLGFPFSDREVFSITPLVAGAGRGFGQIAVGLGLVALAIVTQGGSLAFGPGGFSATSAAFGAKLAAAAGNLGVVLTLSGIATAISPQPDSGIERGREAAKLESFVFSNVVNTLKQSQLMNYLLDQQCDPGLDVDQKQATQTIHSGCWWWRQRWWWQSHTD